MHELQSPRLNGFYHYIKRMDLAEESSFGSALFMKRVFDTKKREERKATDNLTSLTIA